MQLANQPGVTEITVEAFDRWSASALVYEALGITGPNSENIRSWKLSEVPEQKPRRDRSKDKKYRVTLYSTPASAHPSVRTLHCPTPQEALYASMSLAKAPAEEKLGPYHVQEITAEGELITRLVKDGYTFTDVTLTKAEPPAVKDEETGTLTNEEWDLEWEREMSRWYDRPPAAGTGEKTVIKQVSDLFKWEKKVTKPVVKVVRK